MYTLKTFVRMSELVWSHDIIGYILKLLFYDPATIQISAKTLNRSESEVQDSSNGHVHTEQYNCVSYYISRDSALFICNVMQQTWPSSEMESLTI